MFKTPLIDLWQLFILSSPLKLAPIDWADGFDSTRPRGFTRFRRGGQTVLVASCPVRAGSATTVRGFKSNREVKRSNYESVGWKVYGRD